MTLAPWKKSYDNLECIKKQKSVQSKLWFSQWSCMDHKEGWCFWNVVLKRILESPLDSKEIKLGNLWKINTQYSLEGLVLKLQHFGHLMQRADSLEKTLMLGKIDGRRRRGQQRTRWLDGNSIFMDTSLSKLQEKVKHREAWHAAAQGGKVGRTPLSDRTTLIENKEVNDVWIPIWL